MSETRAEVSYRFEEIVPVSEEWQWLRNEYDHEGDPEHPYWALYREVDHPDRLHWVELRRITQRRYVTEWEDAAADEGYARGLIERLINVGDDDEPTYYDPMTYNVNEGLDDCCWFCGHGKDNYFRRVDNKVQHHHDDCPWIEAMDYLGHPHPDHVRENA